MIQVYCGTGKGKTTASIGGAIRARGTGKTVIFSQFMKGNPTGELSILESIPGITILRSNKNYGFYRQLTEEDKKELYGIHNKIIDTIEECLNGLEGTAKEYFIVLDELTFAYQWGLVDTELVCKLLERASKSEEQIEIVVTGNNPPSEILDMADYISEITAKRHPYEQGIGARKGIEF